MQKHFSLFFRFFILRYFTTPLFHYKTLLAHLTGRPRLKSSSKCLLIDFDSPLSPETSEDLSWEVLLREAKTQFGVQKCKV